MGENYITQYTLAGAQSGTFNVAATLITVTNHAREDEAKVVRDCGAGSLGDISKIHFEGKITASVNTSVLAVFKLSDVDVQTLARPFTAVYFNRTAGASKDLFFHSADTGTAQDIESLTWADSTLYYFTYMRTGITSTLLVYSDAVRLTPIAGSPLSNTMADPSSRYIYAAGGHSPAGAGQMSGTVANLKIFGSAELARAGSVYLNDMVW